MNRKDNHILFLEQELRAQVKEFEKKLATNAYDLLFDRGGGLYVAKFIKMKENGELILQMTNSRALPRRRDYLYAFTLPDEKRSYKNWGSLSYGDLVDKKTNYSEVHCIWKSPCTDGKSSQIGFRGISTNFADYINNYPGCIIVLGPQVPPYQYLANLESIVKEDRDKTSDILNLLPEKNELKPQLLQSASGNSQFIINLLEKENTIILQGPPGTGKTQLIAEVAAYYCSKCKSVLITAFTNRALMEVAEKDALKLFLNQQKVSKTNLTSDEIREIPSLCYDKEVTPRAGEIQLATFYVSSGTAKDKIIPSFDLVIMDEASQAFLGMFAATCILGKKQLWVGDTQQMPPISLQNKEHIERHNMMDFVDGMKTVASMGLFSIYQLTQTYRLPPKSANLTSIFYGGSLIPVQNIIEKQGPTLFVCSMKRNESVSSVVIDCIQTIISKIYLSYPKARIAVLSQMKESVQVLDTAIFEKFGNKENLIIDTVARVQGLTTEFVIFVIPKNESMYYSMEPRLFNVATSRAKIKTIIVADICIKKYEHAKANVLKYLDNIAICSDINDLIFQ